MAARLKNEILRFLKPHWPHLLAAIPGAILITVIHESAHACAVLLEGGKVTEFSVLPSGGEWGHIQFRFADQQSFSPVAISMAPYALWLLCCGLAALLALRSKPYSLGMASTIFIWLYIAPLGDIANAAFQYLGGVSNDFTDALGAPDALKAVPVAVLTAAACLGGYPLERRLYRQRSVAPLAYGVLCAATVSAAGVVICLL